jgi:hypothetical protein
MSIFKTVQDNLIEGKIDNEKLVEIILANGDEFHEEEYLLLKLILMKIYYLKEDEIGNNKDILMKSIEKMASDADYADKMDQLFTHLGFQEN